MTALLPIVSRFTAGEASPLLLGRVDLPRHQLASLKLENFIPLLQGPVQKRGGTRFMAKAGNASNPVALLRFEFSGTTSYVMEVGHLYMRFFYQGAPVLDDAGRPYQVATPWRQQDIFDENGVCLLKYIQTADVTFVVCPGQPPQKLSRHAHTNWKIEPLPNWRQNTAGEGQTPKLRPNATAIAMFRERLCLAADSTLYMSQAGAFENFTVGNVGTTPESPMEVNIYAEQLNKIEWLCDAGGLLVGTSGGEFIVSETTTVEPLGPKNIKIVPKTAYGSSNVQALRVGAQIVFVQRSGRTVREFSFETGEDYKSTDLTSLANHIGGVGGFVAMAWQAEPHEILWGVRTDGQLAGFTYTHDQEMFAWHRHILGGDGQVVSLAVIPAGQGGRDEMWLAVKRQINGEPVYYIERLEEGQPRYGATVLDAFFVDCGATYEGPVTATISNLDYLEGQEVEIFADGAPQSPQLVQDGRIHLENPSKKVCVGLAYAATLTTFNMEIMLQDGTMQARTKRLISVSLRLLDSMLGWAGPENDLQLIEYRKIDAPLDRPTSLFTGDVSVPWRGGYETDGRLTIKHDSPMPFTLLALMPVVQIMEGGR